jgi:hypothetical protein
VDHLPVSVTDEIHHFFFSVELLTAPGPHNLESGNLAFKERNDPAMVKVRVQEEQAGNPGAVDLTLLELPQYAGHDVTHAPFNDHVFFSLEEINAHFLPSQVFDAGVNRLGSQMAHHNLLKNSFRPFVSTLPNFSTGEQSKRPLGEFS